MNKNLIYFGSGLAVGIAGTYLYLKDYYNKLIDSETEKVKSYYDDLIKVSDGSLNEINYEEVQDIEEEVKTPEKGDIRPKTGIPEPNYNEIVEKLNYNQFSTKPKADNIVESNSENEPIGPYPISEDLYSETAGRFETQLVSYFIEDDIVMYCDTDEMMDDPGKFIGNENLEELRTNDELEEMYVHNEYMGIDFHIIKEPGSYEEYLAD